MGWQQPSSKKGRAAEGLALALFPGLPPCAAWGFRRMVGGFVRRLRPVVGRGFSFASKNCTASSALNLRAPRAVQSMPRRTHARVRFPELNWRLQDSRTGKSACSRKLRLERKNEPHKIRLPSNMKLQRA